MTDRGEDYADGGFESAARVFYPDPAQIARINEWWARLHTDLEDDGPDQAPMRTV